MFLRFCVFRLLPLYFYTFLRYCVFSYFCVYLFICLRVHLFTCLLVYIILHFFVAVCLLGSCPSPFFLCGEGVRTGEWQGRWGVGRRVFSNRFAT